MSKPIINCQPDKSIEFKADRDEQLSTTLTLTNNTEKNVAFKIKTTAPRSYLVRPSNGIIEPNQSKVVDILLIMHSDVNKNDAIDRFLVVCTTTDSTSALTKAEWNQCNKEDIFEHKLFVHKNFDVDTSDLTSKLKTIASTSIPADYESLRNAFSELVVVASTLSTTNNELRAKLDYITENESPYKTSKPFKQTSFADPWKIAFIVLLIANIIMYRKLST